MRPKERSCLHNTREPGEAASAELEAAASRPETRRDDSRRRNTQQFNSRLLQTRNLVVEGTPSRTSQLERTQGLASRDRLAHQGSGSCSVEVKPETLGPKNMLHLLCLCYKQQPRLETTHLCTARGTEESEPTVETYCSEKRILSKLCCSLTVLLVSPARRWSRTTRWTFSCLSVALDQTLTLTVKSHCVRNTFCKL